MCGGYVRCILDSAKVKNDRGQEEIFSGYLPVCEAGPFRPNFSFFVTQIGNKTRETKENTARSLVARPASVC
jgi:hypothetical protein